ncbi:MAG: arginine--tRNA ligase [Pseudomonadota bacterium]
MNLFTEIAGKVDAALAALKSAGDLPADLSLAGVEVQEPRDAAHGDFAVNAALVLAKRASMKPRDIADLLRAKLVDDADIAACEVAGPGFLNLRLEDAAWGRFLSSVLEDPASFGKGNFGAGKRVQVEYVSANPTGPMHVGHCRGAVFGDALAAVLEAAGFAVTREYYVNDAGAQVDKLGASAILRMREALGETIEIPEGFYPGAYLKPVGNQLAETHGPALLEKPEAEQVAIGRAAAIETMMAEIKADLARLGVHHDVFFSERSLVEGETDQIATGIAVLRDKGLIYEGHLPRPKGHEDDDWEDREQTLFRSTEFGDDVDRALMKSDGTYTYFAGDVGYHYNKLQRSFNHYFNVLGSDHIGYLPRLKAIVSALSDGKADYTTPICNLVKVVRDGKPVQMSKRAGTFVALSDVVSEVGRDPVRFMMLMNKSDTPIDFDLSKVVEQSKDNPVFYVQYAHARLCSVFRNAKTVFRQLDEAEIRDGADAVQLLTDQGERSLLQTLARYPRVLESAARENEPHRLPRYLYELASELHGHWARGNDSPQLRFIADENRSLTMARLSLAFAIQGTLSSGLSLLGVEAPSEMR